MNARPLPVPIDPAAPRLRGPLFLGGNRSAERADYHGGCQKRTVAPPKRVIVLKLPSFRNRVGTKSWRVTGTKPDGNRVHQNYSDKSEAVQAMAA